MTRRGCILRFLTICGYMVGRPAPASKSFGLSNARFYVAGVCFQKVPHNMKGGEIVEIGSGRYHGEICLPISTMAGERIGYVPARLVPVLRGRVLPLATLSVVDEFAVPWKRYEVTAALLPWPV